MNCQLIYYMSRNTGRVESIIKNQLSFLDINIEDVSIATDSKDFPELLINSLESSDFIIVVGGLYPNGKDNTLSIISQIIDSDSLPVEYKKISTNGKDISGYFVECGKQMILLLPDSCDVVNNVLGLVIQYIGVFFGLKLNKPNDNKVVLEKLDFNKISKISSANAKINEDTKPFTNINADTKPFKSVNEDTKPFVEDSKSKNKISGALIDDSCIVASSEKVKVPKGIKISLAIASASILLAGIVIWLLCLFDVISINFLNW